jgi:hypothetical protein
VSFHVFLSDGLPNKPGPKQLARRLANEDFGAYLDLSNRRALILDCVPRTQRARFR